MCIPNRQLDPKTRRMAAFGNLCLVIGLSLWFFVSPVGVWRHWLHALCGLLFGISIGANLFALRCSQRSNPAQS